MIDTNYPSKVLTGMERYTESCPQESEKRHNAFMKKSTLSLTLSTIITLSGNAHALDLLVVRNYHEAASPEIWTKVKTDQVPVSLLASESVTGPQSPYAGIFPKTFFQESLFSVCYQNCSANAADSFRIRNGEIDQKDLSNWNVIEQSNVYYWLKKYFSFLDQKLQYRPHKYLRVMTNREIRDESRNKVMKNNAFFNPADISLSFLPASKSVFFKLLNGKINRSGYDPSVVAHEASHYLFHHLFPNPVNDEIGGLNEGFADYIANIFLNNPKVGLVMMHGKALRDSSAELDQNGKLKTYAPNMEVHDLGERVALALWKSRQAASDKNEMDRLVIDAIQDLGRDPYASVHDFKEKMLERLETILSASEFRNVKNIWDMIFEGSSHKLANDSFLDLPLNDKPILGFRERTVLPEKLAKEMGTPAVTESNFSILQLEKINDKQIAILMGTEKTKAPYWVAIDSERSNILGIFDTDKNLVTDASELEKIKFLADEAKNISNLIKEFNSKVEAFTELAQGKGMYNLVYKIKNQKVTDEKVVFNGEAVQGKKLRIELKRKLLTGVLFGLPDIEAIELIMIPSTYVKGMPELLGQQIIGYKMNLKTGTAVEVLMDKNTL